MNPNTTNTLRQVLTAALEAAGLPVRHIDLFKEPAVMVGAPETGVVLITGPLDEACTDTLGITACRYPLGYDPADPRQDLPEDTVTVYATTPGDPLERAENLACLVEEVTAQVSPPAPVSPAQRSADARALARALGLAPGEDVDFPHLNKIALSAYCRAVAWYGEDAELLADDARQQFEEEQNAHDDEDQGAEPVANAVFVRRARQQLGRSGRPATEPADAHEAERVRALYLDILASAMHALQGLGNDPEAAFDAHEPFVDLQQPVKR
ncbi:hypothetical protein ACOQFV_24475 [Nocardiopsis changdeensis]|uniref:DUF4259 domain-containing protein n=1 Tax=Nocardiopsis changdeensis TaxID=2831969 RepID=A0A975QCB4_9ACTN|nr:MULTISPECIES: hypothetical protein [Nocardiopsis]QUX26453.1 hypothetical protein KGD84_32665 [Nocardiopsis changdeensis]QYX40725.1 hypothetical protein K1J57_32515 [Nocardiopsis sp. MT53]